MSTPLSQPEINSGKTERSTVGTKDSDKQRAVASTRIESTDKKIKSNPQTLEQFIEYAYARRGQRLALKPKVEKQVAQNARLEDGVLNRLLDLAKADILLAVPRQILLVSLELIGRPILKAALTKFVSSVMLSHPVFCDSSVKGAICNLPEGLQPIEAMAKLSAFESLPGGDMPLLKEAELQQLRHNARQLFITWIAMNRSFDAEVLSSILFRTIWHPAAKQLVDASARLRALTEIDQAAAVGLACQSFFHQASHAQAQHEQSQREMLSLRDRVAMTESQLAETGAQLEAVRTELEALRDNSAAESDTLQRQHTIARTHLQHELEQVRGRLIRRLADSVDMLDVGLAALRKETPKIPVMMERAEQVIDALRTEINQLSEG
jgi:hypothetical protein